MDTHQEVSKSASLSKSEEFVAMLQRVAFDVVKDNGVYYIELSGDYAYSESRAEALMWAERLNDAITRVRLEALGQHTPEDEQSAALMMGKKVDEVARLKAALRDTVHDLNNMKQYIRDAQLMEKMGVE